MLNSEESRHPSDTGNLDSQGPASWTIELRKDDVLPRAEQHAGISHLQAKRLAHEHATHVRVRILALTIRKFRVVVAVVLAGLNHLFEKLLELCAGIANAPSHRGRRSFARFH